MVDLEKLYTEQWSRTDGVGALIITPTRELAYQVIKEGGLYIMWTWWEGSRSS